MVFQLHGVLGAYDFPKDKGILLQYLQTILL